jgi:hypothetical protein
MHGQTQANNPDTWSAISYLPQSLRGRDPSSDERQGEGERERERENFGLPRERERERERETFGLPNALRSDTVHQLEPVPLTNVHSLKSTL